MPFPYRRVLKQDGRPTCIPKEFDQSAAEMIGWRPCDGRKVSSLRLLLYDLRIWQCYDRHRRQDENPVPWDWYPEFSARPLLRDPLSPADWPRHNWLHRTSP